MIRTTTWPRVALLALVACRTMSSEVDNSTVDTPAVIVHPNPESRAAITQAVYTTLGGTPVTIADDALTDTNLLVVDRTQRPDPGTLPANGRDMSIPQPERFRLVKVGDRCILVHDRTNHRVALLGTECAPR